MPDRRADANDALIAHAHPLRLVKAFAAIDDRDVQLALITLAEEIARAGQKGRGKRV
jgi:hypothetical protein